MSETKENLFKIGLPLLVLMLAVGVVLLFIINKEPPAQEPREFKGLLVETQRLERTEHELKVNVQGMVIAARQVELRPEVQGKLVKVHENLEPGGRLRAGEVLARIDPRPYERALDRAQAALEEAESNLDLARGRDEVAEADWKYFQENVTDKPETINRSLALQEPQLAIAEARVASARAQVGTAQLNLEYTTVRVPFDCVVLRESVDLGQFVSPQTPMATLTGSESFWMRAALPSPQLQHLSIPGFNAEAGKGSAAVIRRAYQGRTQERSGQVLRLYADLEPRGRMARVLLRIDDPLGLEADGVEMPLLLNSYARAEIDSGASGDYIAVPREAVRGGDKVYLHEDGQLVIRELDIAWGLPEKVLVETGLEAGDRVILTKLASPVEGMKLRRVGAAAEGQPADVEKDPDDA